MLNPYLSIIIPAYNEAERLPKTLLDMDKRLHAVDFSYEIIVANDGSKDKTAEIVTSMEKMIKGLRLLDLKENVGKGGAVRAGMLDAKGVVRLFMDADNATSIDQFEAMMPFFPAAGGSAMSEKEKYDVVFGSRAAKGAKLDPPEPFYRQLVGKGLNLIVQVLLLWGVWDTQCGFKAFTAEAAEKVFGASRVGSWGFDVEILVLAKRFGYRIKEMPVHWVNDTRSTVHFSAGPKFLIDIAKIRWWLWTGGYNL
jgi:glycosyltransferase involved in cell wall biosynthesis